MSKFLLLVASCLTLAACDPGTQAHATALNYPISEGYVTDKANIISDNGKEQLRHLIGSEFKFNQIAVVTVPNMNGQDIQTYANGLARAWGIGEKGKNNGVLVLLALKERKIRIEVGYGLEHVITDSVSQRIIQEGVPFLKVGKYEQGLTHIVDKLIVHLRQTR
jgi:uncharacterized protein